MKKYFKILVLSTILVSAFLFGFLGFNTYAEEEGPIELTPSTEVVESSEAPASQETTDTEESGLFAWFKDIDVETAKTWLIAFLAKAGIDTIIFLILLVHFIRNKIKENRESEKYSETMAKLNAQHQKEIEDLLDSIDAKLAINNETLTQTIKKQNSEKRELAKENVDTMRAALGEIKVNLDE